MFEPYPEATESRSWSVFHHPPKGSSIKLNPYNLMGLWLSVGEPHRPRRKELTDLLQEWGSSQP